jgi:hypothetical protein
MSLRNGSHLPTTQCACAKFVDFATQRNGGGGREKDLCQHQVTYFFKPDLTEMFDPRQLISVLALTPLVCGTAS